MYFDLFLQHFFNYIFFFFDAMDMYWFSSSSNHILYIRAVSFFCFFLSFSYFILELLLRKCFMFHPKSLDFTEFSVVSYGIKWSTDAVDLFTGKNEILFQENSLKLTIESCAFEVFAKSLESQLYTQVVSTFKIMFSEHK